MPKRHEAVEVVGPAGRIKVPAHSVGQYTGRGYRPVDEEPAGTRSRPQATKRASSTPEGAQNAGDRGESSGEGA